MNIRLSITALLLFTTMVAPADQNWDGDNSVGNFSYNDNWYGNSQPGWGFGSGSLYLNFRNNGAQSSLYYDYGAWVNTNDVIWETTFGAGLTWNGNGNGINFNQRLENRSSFTQTIGTMNFSGAKNGATQIEINPVNGNIVLNGSLFNDNAKPYYVYGNNGKSLTLNTTLGVGSSAASVSFNVAQNSNVIFGADQNYAGGTVISAGSLQVGAGGTVGKLGTGTVTNNASLIFNRSDVVTVSNTINGSGNVTQSGSGTTTLTGGNGYSGTTTLTSGILAIQSDGNLGAVPGSPLNKILFTGNATLQDAVNNIALNANRNLTISNGITATLDNNGNDFTINGGINGAGGNLELKGGGKTTLNGAGSYTGTTKITGGTLVLGTGSALPSASAFTLSGARLNVNGKTASTGVLNETTGTNIIDFSNGNGQITFSNTGTWTGILSIWNYTGAILTAGTDKLIFTTNGLTSSNLSNIHFYSGEGTGKIDTSGAGFLAGGELVPVPEPGAMLAALGLLGAIAYRERRHWLHYRPKAV